MDLLILQAEPEFWAWMKKAFMCIKQDNLYYQELLACGMDYDVEIIKQTWYAAYTPDTGVWDLLKSLKGKYKRICFTGNIPSRIEYLQNRYNFEDLFDIKVTLLASFLSHKMQLYSYDYHMSKSEPQFIQTLINKAGCAPEEIILVDDEDKHRVVAESQGMHCVLHQTGKSEDLKAKLRVFGVTC